MTEPISLFANPVILSPEPYSLPQDWMGIRTEMLGKIKWEHLNRLHDGELGSFNFDTYFAASDTLLDVGNILFVAKTNRWPAWKLEAQLWMYGALQTLVVQRDSVWQLINCFGIAKEKVLDQIFDENNQIRVATVGHPSGHYRKNTKIKGETFLAHGNHATGRFQIGTYETDKKYLQRDFCIPDMIKDQDIACFEYMKFAHNALIDDPTFNTDNWEKFPI